MARPSTFPSCAQRLWPPAHIGSVVGTERLDIAVARRRGSELQSRASRRQRLIQTKLRSTTPLLGSKTKPRFASDVASVALVGRGKTAAA
jgi:hypothetical protein